MSGDPHYVLSARWAVHSGPVSLTSRGRLPNGREIRVVTEFKSNPQVEFGTLISLPSLFP